MFIMQDETQNDESQYPTWHMERWGADNLIMIWLNSIMKHNLICRDANKSSHEAYVDYDATKSSNEILLIDDVIKIDHKTSRDYDPIEFGVKHCSSFIIKYLLITILVEYDHEAS